jgi:energy-coupling factor transport system ATP-binding protein
VALASVSGLTFAYPAAAPALEHVSLELEPGEVVALLGPSGSGKSTLLRALAGLVPHFHGGRFSGRVVVAGHDTRIARPADLAGTIATVFQDPEDQVVMSVVANEVAFGLENLGVAPAEIWPRAERALAAVDALHLWGRRTAELSGGELQRVCLASALALEPRLLLLDEPTSQLDPESTQLFLEEVSRLGATVVFSDHRVSRALELATRVLFLDRGRVLLDASPDEAAAWLAAERPRWTTAPRVTGTQSRPGGSVLRARGVSFAFRDAVPVLAGVDLDVGRGEIVALEGPNGSGKTTLARIVSGLLEPDRGTVELNGRAGYLAQDPGRYLVEETALREVGLAVRRDDERARAALAAADLDWAAERHPRDLSSGERQRLALSAVAVAEPDLLVLDEPTRGLDPDRKAALAARLEAYAAAGRGVLVATHDAEFPAHRRIRLCVPETQGDFAPEGARVAV